MSEININEYLENLDRGDYQRENFDSFLKKVSFSYNIPSIHIAGSNGKGTTANYLANIYRSYGLKVGLFTSPYLNNVNEMININGVDITDDEINAWIDTGRAFGKAGAYAIQEEFGRFIKKIDGDYYTIVGLPLNKLYNILKDLEVYDGL